MTKVELEKIKLETELNNKRKLKAKFFDASKAIDEIYLDFVSGNIQELKSQVDNKARVEVRKTDAYLNNRFKKVLYTFYEWINLLVTFFVRREKVNSDSTMLVATPVAWPKFQSINDIVDYIQSCDTFCEVSYFEAVHRIEEYKKDVKSGLRDIRRQIRKHIRLLGFNKGKSKQIHGNIVNGIISSVFQRISSSTGKEEDDLNGKVETTLSNKFNQLLNYKSNEKRIKRTFSRYFNKYFACKYQAYFETRYYPNYAAN